MGEHSRQLASDRRQTSRKQPRKPTAVELGRRLLAVIVYDRNCRIGGQVSLDDLEATEALSRWAEAGTGPRNVVASLPVQAIAIITALAFKREGRCQISLPMRSV